MSQLELSEGLGYKSVSSIAKPEIYYRRTHFSLEQLFNISEELEIPLEELLK